MASGRRACRPFARYAPAMSQDARGLFVIKTIIISSPLRYIIILPLLAAVTLVCGTGAWMGMRKLGRDLQRILRRMSRRPFFFRSQSQS